MVYSRSFALIDPQRTPREFRKRLRVAASFGGTARVSGLRREELLLEGFFSPSLQLAAPHGLKGFFPCGQIFFFPCTHGQRCCHGGEKNSNSLGFFLASLELAAHFFERLSSLGGWKISLHPPLGSSSYFTRVVDFRSRCAPLASTIAGLEECIGSKNPFVF